MNRVITLIVLFTLILSVSYAADPERIAIIDRSKLRQGEFYDQFSYDQMSRAEILAFSQVMLDTEKYSLKELVDLLDLNLQQIDMISIDIVRQQFWNKLLENYQESLKSCGVDCQPVNTIAQLQTLTRKTPVDPERRQFYRNYFYEQFRLAAIFPRVSSEIRLFSATEINGFELQDGQFILSFNDGPGQLNGSTDKLLSTLKQYELHSLFFLLGEKTQQRLQHQSSKSLAKLYDGQCVSSHGWQHISHVTWREWQESVISTHDLLATIFGSHYIPAFRPPFGMRKADDSDFFRENKLSIVLWNIDSQDQNNQITKKQVGDRVITLMLLWRKGIILFHDVNDKARSLIPLIYKKIDKTEVKWLDCHQMNINSKE